VRSGSALAADPTEDFPEEFRGSRARKLMAAMQIGDRGDAPADRRDSPPCVGECGDIEREGLRAGREGGAAAAGAPGVKSARSAA